MDRWGHGRAAAGPRLSAPEEGGPSRPRGGVRVYVFVCIYVCPCMCVPHTRTSAARNKQVRLSPEPGQQEGGEGASCCNLDAAPALMTLMAFCAFPERADSLHTPHPAYGLLPLHIQPLK